MALTDISNDIQDITGVTTADTDFIESAQRFVVSSVPKELLWFASTISSEITDGNGYDIQSADSVLSVEREGYPAPRVPFAMSKWIDDSASLHKATVKHPKYYVAQGKVFIKPDPSAGGSNDGYVYYIDYSQIDDDCDLRNAVIFHACSKEFSQLATDGLPSWTSPSLPVAPATPDFGSDLTISTAAPVAPSSPSFTYTDASVGDIVKPLISISDMASMTESAPSYTKPVVSLEAKPSITSLTISAVVPVAPTISTISYSAATNSDATVSLLGSTTVTSPDKADISGDVPTYTKPVKSAQTAFSDYTSGLTETDPGTFSITAVSPVAPDDPGFTTPGISTVTISNVGTPPTYTSPVVGGAIEELTASIDAATAGEATDKYDYSRWFDLVADFIEDEEDTELASSQIQKINSYINAYSQAMQNQLNIFNDANAEYQGKLQEAIQQAQINAQEAQQEANLILQEENQEYAAKLQKYSANVNRYQADVTKEVQEYQQKLSQYNLELNTSLQAWQKTESDNIQVYQADIQNELNEFNKENTRYQANVQAEIAKHNSDLQKALNQAQIDSQNVQQEARQITEVNQFNKAQDQVLALENASKQMEDDIADNNSKVQKYSAELQRYQAEVTKEVQQFQQNLGKELQLWETNRTTVLQKYASDIQNEVSEFNKENVLYQQDIQRKVQNLQKDVQEAVQNAQNDIAVNNANLGKDVQIALQNAIQDFQQDVQEYGSKIQRYGAELNQYQHDIGKEVQDYTNTLNKESQEYQSKLALYNADLQKFQSDVAERGQESTVKYQNTQYYEKASDKYYQWAQNEITQYIQNNSKMINQTIAAQAQAQQQQQYRR